MKKQKLEKANTKLAAEVPWFDKRLTLEKGLDPSLVTRAGGSVKTLEAVGHQVDQLNSGHRSRLYVLIATVFAVARLVGLDRDAWEDICKSPLWEEHSRHRPKVDDRSTAWSTCLKIAFGPEDRKRVSLYKRALQAAFDSDVKPKDVPKLIEAAGGFDILARKAKDSTSVEVTRGGTMVVVLPGKSAKLLPTLSPDSSIMLEGRIDSVSGGIVYLKPRKAVRVRPSSMCKTLSGARKRPA